MAWTDDDEMELELAKAKARARQADAAPTTTPSGLPVAKEPGWFEPGSVSGALTQKAGDFLQGFGQGASLGFSDELAGLGGAALAGGAEAGGALFGASPEETAERVYRFTGKTPGEQRSAYEVARDIQRATQAEAQARSPELYEVGELSGGMMSTAGVPVSTIGRGGKLIPRAVELAKSAVPISAVSSLGYGQSDLAKGEVPSALAETAFGTAIGAPLAGATGAATEKTLHLAGVGALKLARLFGSNIQKAKLNAFSPAAGIADALRKRKLDTPDAQREFVREIDRLKLLKPTDTTENILERVWTQQDKRGPVIEELIQKADANVKAGKVPPGVQASRDWQKARTRDVFEKYWKDPISAAETTGEFAKIEKVLPRDSETWDGKGPSFEELWETKKSLERSARERLKSSAAQERTSGRALQDIVDAYRTGFYEQLEQALGRDDFKKLKSAAKDYASLAKAEDLVSEKYSREQSHKMFGLSDLVKMSTAATVGATQGFFPAAAATAAVGASALARPRAGALTVTGLTAGQAAATQAARAGIGAAERIAAPVVRDVAGTGAVQARRNAYEALRQRLGIDAGSPEAMADEAFLKGQQDEEFQPGRRRR